MDIFKQKQYSTIAIVILIVMNLGLTALLWLGRPQNQPWPAERRSPRKDKNKIGQLLKQELNFDDSQVKQYLDLQYQHRQSMIKLDTEIREMKHQMFDAVLLDRQEQMFPDSLLIIIQEKQAQIERLTYQHFMDLKELCRTDQQDQLRFLMHEYLRPQAPPEGHRPPKKGGGQQPPGPPPRRD